MTFAAIMAMQAAAPVPAVDANGWMQDETTSALDGAKTYLAIKAADAPVLNAAGLPDQAMLGVACRSDGVPAVSLAWPAFLGVGEVWVDAAVDGGPVRKWTFDVRSNTAFFSGTGNARRFSQAVRGGSKITVRVHGYNNTQEATFDLAGVQDVLNRARQRCPFPA